MKVTVCFGPVRVVVPCGTSGQLTVRKLTKEAVARYKKATNKSAECAVTVRSLRSSADFAILDEDDLICDVADDRDQLIAEFEEEPPLPVVPIDLMTSTTTTTTSSFCSHHCDGVFPPSVAFNNNNNNNNNNNKSMIIGVDVSGDDDFLSNVVVDQSRSKSCVDDDLAPATDDNTGGDDDGGGGVGVSDGEPCQLVITAPRVCPPLVLTQSLSEPHRLGSSEPNSPASFASDQLSPVSPSKSFTRDSSRKSLGNGLSMQKWFVAQEKISDPNEEISREVTIDIAPPPLVVAAAEDESEEFVSSSPAVSPIELNHVDDATVPCPAVTPDSSCSPPRRPPRHIKPSSSVADRQKISVTHGNGAELSDSSIVEKRKKF